VVARDPVTIARHHQIAIVHDLGSGTLVELKRWNLAHELHSR
jgi:seryl-tRNA(Sec) selenium transferase